jgi:selenophosphate synthase
MRNEQLEMRNGKMGSRESGGREKGLEKAKKVWYEESLQKVRIIGLKRRLKEARKDLLKENHKKTMKEINEIVAQCALIDDCHIDTIHDVTGFDMETINNLRKKVTVKWVLKKVTVTD